MAAGQRLLSPFQNPSLSVPFHQQCISNIKKDCSPNRASLEAHAVYQHRMPQCVCVVCAWGGRQWGEVHSNSLFLLSAPENATNQESLGVLRIFQDNPAKILYLWVETDPLLHSEGIWPPIWRSLWLTANHCLQQDVWILGNLALGQGSHTIPQGPKMQGLR